MPAENLIEFILYIAPGFLVREVYYAYTPRRKKSNFAQIAWSVIYGVFIYAVVSWVDKDFFNYYLGSNTGEFPNIGLIIALFCAGIGLSLLFIVIHKIRRFVTKYDPKLRIIGVPLHPNFQNIWEEVTHDSNKNWAVVFLSDGSIYRGWIKNYNLDPNSENQDFLLTRATRINDQLKEIYKVKGKGVYLNTRDVVRIEFLEGTKKI